ncbi:hypothetical protein P8452_22985 [Trifolium repens]|nr:hypothetical protein P8452_22985 [Trifolium repens]
MNTSKAEAERLLEIGEELLQKRDLKGSREIANLVQETEPLLEGSDQILAIVDVLEAAEKPLNLNNHHLDWVYEGCCLMCQKCDKSFHGVSIPSLPPIVPGQEAYNVSWGMFPMGFVFESLENGGSGGDDVVGSGTRK